MPLKIHSKIVLTFILVYAQLSIAQQVVFSGDVRDQNTYQKIRSVNIFIKGTSIGTTSNFSGNFELKVPEGQSDDLVIVFQHIAYYEKHFKLSELRDTKKVYLQPRVIPLTSVEIEEEGVQRIEIKKDLPQAITVINARSYDIRGYVDAGDLLKVDQSVQVEEDMSGKKTVAIRGGNSDEVIVLYNGVKMNNAYNNIFDLSLIDLENVERMELIKGSNTALYGPEAFSGVINIVPKLEQDYNIRFQQRLGTYRSGNWGLHFFKKFNQLYGSYSVKRGGLSRNFVDVPDSNGNLENTSLHHNANLNLDIGTNSVGKPKGTLSSMFVYTALDYDNYRDNETLDNFNNLFSLRYKGEFLGKENVDFAFSYKNLEEDQALSFDQGNSASGVEVDREVKDKAYMFNSNTVFSQWDLELLLSYQFQRNELDFLDFRQGSQIQQIGLEAANLSRNHHGLVSIAKYHGDAGSDFLQSIDIDVSLRHDRVYDRQENVVLRGAMNNNAVQPGSFGNNDWNSTMFKLAFDLSGYKDGFSFDSYLSFGKNTKFPTLFQQISIPSLISDPANSPTLDAEKNSSVEIGLNLGRDLEDDLGSIYGWKLSGSFFQNHYDNKFREFTTPGIPVSFYDNAQNAHMSGFEGKGKVFLFQKKIALDLAISKYNISDKALFPFKSEQKRTLTLNIDHAGYAFQLLWFNESEQVALLRFLNGGFGETDLPSNTNLDLHISKTFEISKLKAFANASGRNLLNDNDVVLEGLAIRDRRFYVTFGLQY